MFVLFVLCWVYVMEHIKIRIKSNAISLNLCSICCVIMFYGYVFLSVSTRRRVCSNTSPHTYINKFYLAFEDLISSYQIVHIEPHWVSLYTTPDGLLVIILRESTSYGIYFKVCVWWISSRNGMSSGKLSLVAPLTRVERRGRASELSRLALLDWI